MFEIIYFFLDKFSVLWFIGFINLVQENFMSYLIWQKIVVVIDNEILVSGKDVKWFFIYLLEGEKQEFSMLFMYYLLKFRGNYVVYIGQDIIFVDFKDV